MRPARRTVRSAKESIRTEVFVRNKTMKRGRKTLLDNIVPLDATSQRSRLSPPASLSKDERAIFDLVVAENSHLTLLDAPMLTAFAQAAAKTISLAKKEGIQAWERSARIMAMLATRLRITPQSTATAQTLARHRRDRPPDHPPPWEYPTDD
jgi:hypothetical protein